MRTISPTTVLTLLFAMILVGCGGKANTPSLPAELAPLKSHLAVQSESVEQGTTVVTYGVDLPYEDAYSQVSSLLTKAKWTTSGLRIGRSTKVKVAVFNKSKDETLILQDAPGGMDRAPGAGSVTLNHIVANPSPLHPPTTNHNPPPTQPKVVSSPVRQPNHGPGGELFARAKPNRSGNGGRINGEKVSHYQTEGEA